MTHSELIAALGDIAGRFDVSPYEADTIAKRALQSPDPEAEFIRIWTDESWWRNNA